MVTISYILQKQYLQIKITLYVHSLDYRYFTWRNNIKPSTFPFIALQLQDKRIMNDNDQYPLLNNLIILINIETNIINITADSPPLFIETRK